MKTSEHVCIAFWSVWQVYFLPSPFVWNTLGEDPKLFFYYCAGRTLLIIQSEENTRSTLYIPPVGLPGHFVIKTMHNYDGIWINSCNIKGALYELVWFQRQFYWQFYRLKCLTSSLTCVLHTLSKRLDNAGVLNVKNLSGDRWRTKTLKKPGSS